MFGVRDYLPVVVELVELGRAEGRRSPGAGEDQIIGNEVGRGGVDRELRLDACVVDSRRRRVVGPPTMRYQLTG